jgi:copper ion binding protein
MNGRKESVVKKLAVLLFAVASACYTANATTKTTTLSVKGWTCGSCAVSTRIALKKLSGVTTVTTNDEKKEAVITYDDSVVTPARMIEAIEKLGYSASVTESATPTGGAVARTTLSVSDVSCEGCVAAFERRAKQVSGVTASELSATTGKAEISYDPVTTDAGAIAEELLKAGFKARLSPWEPVDATFTGCSNGSCGTRIANAAVSPQPGATVGQRVYCPVSGVVLEVSATTPTVEVDGKPIRVCCEGCARYFKANRERVLALRGLDAKRQQG